MTSVSSIFLFLQYIDVGCNGHVKQYKAPEHGDWQVGSALLLRVHSCDNSMLMQFCKHAQHEDSTAQTVSDTTGTSTNRDLVE